MMTWRGGREVQEGGGVCMQIVDPLPCTAETQHWKAIVFYSYLKPEKRVSCIKRNVLFCMC